MSKLLLLYSIFILSVLFLIVPRTEPMDFFLFTDIEITFQTHLYFICEHIVVIVLAWIVLQESKSHLLGLRWFFWLCVADLMDYLLTYNSVWFRISEFPVSMNTVTVIVFGLVILYSWIYKD